MRKLHSITIAFLLLAAPAFALDVDNPPAGKFSDEWYAIMINDAKSGHAHSTIERVKGTDTIRTSTDMTITMKRLGEGVKVSVTQKTEETLKGEPLAFSNIMRLGALPISTKGTIKNGKVTVQSTQMQQQAQAKVYDLPDGAKMSWAVYRETLKQGLKPGTRYEFSIYEPSIAPDKLMPATVEIGDKETIDLFGRKLEAIKTKQTMTIRNMIGQQTPVDTITWMTEEGDPVRVRMVMMDIPIELLACTKTVALSPDEPAEMMASTLIPVSEPVDRNAEKITYRVSLKNAGKAKLLEFPETPTQKVKRDENGVVSISVTRGHLNQHEAPASAQLSNADRERFTAATPMLNHKDPEVAKLANKAADGEKDPRKLADRLRRFVTDYVQTKNLNVGFATASEVARSKEGDCSEHGVLLAALGRALGIPTRLVTGLVYVENFRDHQNVFGGHLWTQFWIEDKPGSPGRWVDLDAAQRQTEVDATHIAMSLTDGGDGGVADLVNSIWLNLGNLKIEVVK